MDEDQPSLFTVSAATNVRDGEMEGNGDSQMMDQLQTPPTETTNVLAKDEHDYKIRTRVIKRLGPEDRKQSASDLQSRLKTRKLLGVGELVGDNGDIYRSKISQLLGINESLYVRLPRGLLIWNSLLTVYIYVTGAMCMFAPSLATYIEFGYATPPTDLFPFRMYGAVMLTFGLLFRGLLALKDTRSEISVLLLVCAMLFLLQLLVTFFTCRCTLMLTSLRVIGVIGSLIYQSLLDGQSGTLRQFIRYVEDLFMHADNTPSRSSSCDEREKDKTS